MRHAAIAALCLVLTTAQAGAQSTETENDTGSESESGSLMEKGLGLFLEGLKDELSPAMKNLQDMADQYGPAFESFLAEMGPALAELLAKIDNWQGYHPPEILENGDIIMRKRTEQDPDSDTKSEKKPSGATDI